MKQAWVICLVMLAAWGAKGQTTSSNTDEAAIRQLLALQEQAWNRGDIGQFMQGYWKNDSLTFTGAKGITYGWQNTYNNYLKNYSNPNKMGKLTFTLLELLPMGEMYCAVIGQWQLKRSIGDVSGHFTLIFRRFANGWKIIADHTS